MGIVENAPSSDRELVVTVLAVQNLYAVYEPHNQPFAAWAFRAIGPAEAFQKFPAKIIIGERVAKLDNGHRRLLRG
jgi:hypothetical protein